MKTKSTQPVTPRRGGFLRIFGCGGFIRESLMGKGPYGSPKIDPEIGAPQSDIFQYYKEALIRTTAEDRAIRQEERQAKREDRLFDPDRAEELIQKHIQRIRYKSSGMSYHSFVVYFSNLKRLGWVKTTGYEEPSSFQDNFPPGPPRRYYVLTKTGKEASESAWKNPHKTLYGQQKHRPRKNRKFTPSGSLSKEEV